MSVNFVRKRGGGESNNLDLDIINIMTLDIDLITFFILILEAHPLNPTPPQQ